MSKPYPKLCKDCVHSVRMQDRQYILYCDEPRVNANDPSALSGTSSGADCFTERSKRFFGTCGMAGRRWEAK